LHDAEVVEHGEERRHKDDGGQHLEGKKKAQLPTAFAEFAEDELGSGERKRQHVANGSAGFINHQCPKTPLQNQKSEHNLQPQAPGDGFGPDGATVS
jgi:hypothetical protein